ncbi:hypothetical protein NUW58_g6234 [Xylaria curta]|uniref:Uncharacterized protein n=1 Tax=Xylaria curta TaxID=42375 RepID=A0ACC1NWN4_9PEZI|nr:hypothetical protein NUW58_g6234 [Xylaria curta]
MGDSVTESSSSDDVIKSHIEHLVRTNLPNSAIYNFLLSDAFMGPCLPRSPIGGGMAIATFDLRAKTGVSVDIHVRYLSSAREGDEVEIEGTAEKVGGSIAFMRIVISKVVDGIAGPVIASGTHTKYVKLREPPKMRLACSP